MRKDGKIIDLYLPVNHGGYFRARERKTIERRNEKRKKGTERRKERIKRVSYLGHIVKQ